MTHTLRIFDDKPVTHVLVEPYLPKGEIWHCNGFCFVPPEFRSALGEPDDALAIGDVAFPAWSLDGSDGVR